MTKQFIADASRSIAIMLVATHCICAQELSPSLVSTKPESGHFVKCDDGYMVEHSFQIPGTDIQFDLVPIPPLNRDRQPFWIGKHEVTFRQYREYCRLYDTFTLRQRKAAIRLSDVSKLDAVTAPTEVYDPSARFELAESLDCPAFSMTQYSAKQFTKWLSLISETPFRLPMEAEWELAASNRGPQKVCVSRPLSESANFNDHHGKVLRCGSLSGNSWGLFDVQGNVSEWVITRLSPRDIHRAFDRSADNNLRDVEVAELPTWAAKGGHFASTRGECGISERFVPTLDLWDEEANVPLSTTWLGSLGDESKIGFRVVRTYGALDKRLMQRYWDPASIEYQFDIDMKIDEGRGRIGGVGPELPQEILKLNPSYPEWKIAPRKNNDKTNEGN